jgi:peptidoglycan-associated lipoprotein
VIDNIEEEKMKRIFAVLVFILAIITVAGCAHKQIAPAQQPEAAAPTPAPSPKEEAAAPKEAVSEKPMAPAEQAGGKEAEKELATKLEDIHFDFDKSDIRDDAKPILKNLSAILSSDAKKHVVIEGNCDARGTSEYNLALGDRRANEAKTYLVSLGILSERIKTISYGKEKPLCTESTEECYQTNRRDHFVLTVAP